MRYLWSVAHRPLVVTWLLALPALSPLFQPSLTRSADGLLHLYRLIALHHLISQGVLFPRWWPDLAYGYGMPLFVYYAPLSYYLTELPHLLGLNPILAFNVSAALALLTAASGVYLLGRDWFGSQAGVLAAVAYVYAPYQLFNLFSRGSLPVAWAGALFPLTFWAFGRLIQTGQTRYLPLAALSLGAALLMHNISNLLFFPLLCFYVVITFLFKSTSAHQRVSELFSPATADSSHTTHHALRILPPISRLTSHVSLALLLGLALSAFFWLPATLERDFAQLQRVITPPDFDYHSNFVSLCQLFALPPAANTGLLNPSDPLTLGPAQVFLGFMALLITIWRLGKLTGAEVSPCSSAPLLFAILALGIAIFMMLPLSVGLWERLPLIAFVQQPHRLLSLAAFLLAILAGAAAAGLPEGWRTGLTLTGIVAIFITSAPLLYPRYYSPLPAAPTLPGMLDYERTTGAIGATSFGEYLPVWVRQIPRESPLEAFYRAEKPIERLDQAYLPAQAVVEAANYGLNQADLVLDSPQPFQAVFHTFYFPGWRASVDGQPAPIAPVTERGLIGVSLPAGRHHLHLYFGETPIRAVANAISLLAFLITLAVTVKTLHIQHSTFNLQSQRDALQSPISNLQPVTIIGLLVLALTLILTKTLYLDHFDNPLKRVFTGQVAEAGVSRQVNFGDQVNLLGYNLPASSLSAAETFSLTLFWQARHPLTTNYSALAQLVDDQQHLYAGQDNLHPGSLPSSRWEPWGFVQDAHPLHVPPGTPPGDYFLVAGLYDPMTWTRLPVLAGGDAGWSDVIAIPVRLTRPESNPTPAELGITWPTQTFEVSKTSKLSTIRLLGATPERETIQRNDFMRLALFWEAVEQPDRDYQISLRLLAADGVTALTETSQPSFGRYPTSRWAADERVRDNHALWIPPDLAAGVYRVQIRLLDEGGQVLTEWIELGQLAAQ